MNTVVMCFLCLCVIWEGKVNHNQCTYNLSFLLNEPYVWKRIRNSHEDGRHLQSGRGYSQEWKGFGLVVGEGIGWHMQLLVFINVNICIYYCSLSSHLVYFLCFSLRMTRMTLSSLSWLQKHIIWLLLAPWNTGHTHSQKWFRFNYRLQLCL